MAAPDFAENAQIVENLTSGDTIANATIANPGSLTAPTTTGQTGAGTYARRTTLTGGENIGVRVSGFTAMDLTQSSSTFVMFSMTHTDYGAYNSAGETGANGGALRVYFEDSGGNYSGWWVLGRDWLGNTDGYSRPGSFTSFSNHALEDCASFFIDRTATADWSSGTLDWTDVTAMEIHFATRASISVGAMDVYVSHIGCGTDWEITGGDVTTPGSFALIQYDLDRLFGPNYGTTGLSYRRCWSKFAVDFETAASGVAWLAYMGGSIGDGTAATRFESDGESVLWAASRETFEDAGFDLAGRSEPPVAIPWCYGLGVRTLVFNQSATCVAALSNGTMSGCDTADREWAVEVTGSVSGTFTSEAEVYWFGDHITCGHGTFTDCTFNTLERVEIDGDTTMTGCTIAGTRSGDLGLYVATGPTDYGAIGVEFKASNSGYDLTINPSSAGTFTFDGLSVEAGHTLSIRNESATLAITVEIPAGITTSTSTAGGTVTVSSPPLDVKVTCVDTSGSPIQNARVLVEEDPGGADVISGLTDVNGEVSDTYSGGTPQAITGTARKATTSPLYKPAPISGSITSAGLDITVVMSPDE